MGGIKGKKKERQEKTKIKLKVKKTILPKGQNVTDTSFKIKKIVIREQLKAANEAEPLTRRKLNVKELLSRLRHHNTNVRQDGLDGLKELTTGYPPEVFSPHLSALIEGITALILDGETVIRRDALKLLKSILTQVTSNQIQPFFDVLQSYLSCAMTHIHTVTQEDSLLLLDVMLETTPSLVADRAHKILPNFLDMISKLRTDARPDRLLTVNLGSKLTSVKWRIKVLTRLHSLLAALAANRAAKLQGESGGGPSLPVRAWRCTGDKALTVPVYYPLMARTCQLPALFGGAVKDAETSGADLKAYMAVLMPLLFETWLEVAPIGGQEAKQDTVLTEESAELLRCIVEIIQLAWEYLLSYEQETKLIPLASWFKGEYEKDVRKYLMPGFPFTATVSAKKAGRGKGKNKRHQEYADSVARTSECVEQNLAVCHVLCCVHDKGELALCRQIVTYVTKCVLSWEQLESSAMNQLVKVLRIVLMMRSAQWTARRVDVDALLNACLQSVDKLNPHFQAVVFEMLSDLVLDPTLRHLLQCSGFEDWRTKLPNVLCQSEVLLKTVKVLTRLACQNNRPFLDSLTEKLPQILGNITTLSVVGAADEIEGRYSVANLLYWVSKTPDFTSLLAEHSTNWDQQLIDYVRQIVG